MVSKVAFNSSLETNKCTELLISYMAINAEQFLHIWSDWDVNLTTRFPDTYFDENHIYTVVLQINQSQWKKFSLIRIYYRLRS